MKRKKECERCGETFSFYCEDDQSARRYPDFCRSCARQNGIVAKEKRKKVLRETPKREMPFWILPNWRG